MTTQRFRSTVALLLVVAVRPATAQTDVKDGADHPLVGRFAGAIIRAYEAKDFDGYTVGLGRLSYRGNVNTFEWAKAEKIEGKVTRVTYLAPAAASPLAIVRSYEDALKQAGFEVLFSAADQTIGYRYDSWYYRAYPDPTQRRQNLLGAKSAQYLVTKLRRSQGDVYAIVYVALGGLFAKNSPTIQLDVIEIKALAAGLVTASRMADEIARTGRVALYTLYFDTDRAEVKPESEPTFKEIATLLRARPALKLYIVGHTDNMGALAYNVDLSQRRAEAVVKRLIAAHGGDAVQIRSAGVGPLAPVTTNETEDGRATNRRVELVAQ